MLKYLFLLAAAATIGFFALKYFTGQSGLHPVKKAKPGQIRVACVGDSITYGHGTAPWPLRTYPARLQKYLGSRYCVNNFGFNGKTVNPDCGDAYTATGVYTASLNFKADIVVFMMGTNDAKPRNWRGEETFRQDLETILARYSGARLVLCTPAAAFYEDGVTQGLACYDICPETVQTAARLIREVARERNCELVDIRALTADKPQWYIADGIHPGNTGADAIACAIAGQILRREEV